MRNGAFLYYSKFQYKEKCLTLPAREHHNGYHSLILAFAVISVLNYRLKLAHTLQNS